MTADDIRAETIGEFVAARRAAGCSSQLTGRSLAWMLGYLRGLGAVPPAAAPGPAAGAGQLLERFGAFLANERGLAGKTRGAHLDSARRFLAAVGPDGESGPPLSALTASDVTAFLAGMARIQASDRPVSWLEYPAARRAAANSPIVSAPMSPAVMPRSASQWLRCAAASSLRLVPAGV